MNCDLQNRSPRVERLPDGRLRVTRTYDVLNFIPKTPALLLADVWLGWGTADTEFTSCRLIKQDVSGQDGEFRAPCKEPPKLARVFEEISATAETLVGSPDIEVTQYGYKSVTYHWIQLSANAPTYQVPGTTTGPAPFTALILRDQQATDDGTVRLITRTYIEGGYLADYEELKFSAKLVLRTIKSLLVEPTTPAGYTRVTRSKEYAPNGAIVYSYGYTSAASSIGLGGEINRKVEYNLSPDQGGTGVTVTTIETLTDSSVTSNPITGPVGSQLISVTYSDEGGFRTWRAVFASGTGLVKQDKDIKEAGKLIVYTRTSINSVPSTPAATIGGTVTAIQQNQRNGTDAAAGVIVYDYVFAEGFGEAARSVRYDQSVDAGATAGATIWTIIHLTALGASDPTSAPAGTTKIASVPNAQDGYLVWTVTYAGGTGTVRTVDDTKYNGALLLRKITALGSAPATPSGYVSTATDVRNADGYQVFDYDFAKGLGEISRDTDWSQGASVGSETIGVTKTTVRYLMANGGTDPTAVSGSTKIGASLAENDGYEISTTVWAKGVGLVVDESDIQVKGILATLTRVALGAVPATPTGVLGGTIVLVEDSDKNADGYHIFTRRWAEFTAVTITETTTQEDGATVYSVTSFTTAAATPANPGSSYLIKLEQTPQGGYFRNTAIYKKPPATVTLKKLVSFTWPGLANFSGTDLLISPPTKRDLLADQEVSYSTSQVTDVPYKVNYGTYFRDSYIRTNNNDVGESHQQMLGYTLAGAASISGTDAEYNGMLCDSYEASLTSSSPTTVPSGLTVIDVDNQIYLVAIDGTVVFRRIKVSFTF